MLQVNDKVAFLYNDKVRSGVVKAVGTDGLKDKRSKAFFVVEDGDVVKNFNFAKVQGEIQILV